MPNTNLEAVEAAAAEQGPRFPSRKAAWLDGYREGRQHDRMTGGRGGAKAVEAERKLIEKALAVLLYPDEIATAKAVAQEHTVREARRYLAAALDQEADPEPLDERIERLEAELVEAQKAEERKRHEDGP